MIRPIQPRLHRLMAIAMLVLKIFAPRARADSYQGMVLFQLAGARQGDVTLGIDSRVGPGVIAGQLADPISGDGHACIWTGPAGASIGLHPSGSEAGSYSYAFGVAGNQQVGFFASPVPGSHAHAVAWSGSAASMVDIHPTNLLGYADSYARATNGSRIVGEVFSASTSERRPVVWDANSTNAVDLKEGAPIHISSDSSATGISPDGQEQVGYMTGSDPTFQHALRWRGTAASAVDLNPAGLGPGGYPYRSLATAGSGAQEVGYVDTWTSPAHACLWSGTAGSRVDLHPTNLAGAGSSVALGIAGAEQVGYATFPGDTSHAILWHGTPNSAIDLHLLLPTQFDRTEASIIDAQGNIFGTATYADADSGVYAVEWIPVVPEPDAALLSVAVGTTTLRRYRRARTRLC